MMKIVSGVMLTLLFMAILSSSFNIRPVRGEWTGTVYIRADGSITLFCHRTWFHKTFIGLKTLRARAVVRE